VIAGNREESGKKNDWAIARFEKRLKIARSLEKRLKQVIKLLNVEM
jgi:hypothetical protein